ncbi:hypothetical protein [Streptomyces anulatus]|uniref:hypothetical protein n=1 Tax=Streptomyces anulatus TaxID=1892 RepID=UPI0034495E85|nr:hypothetical protein OG238_00015 [Streptomyces anulatus]WST90452.1 hypothetical protein OG238_41515 [Streptomyces anulatus]
MALSNGADDAVILPVGLRVRERVPTDVFDTYKQLPELARRDLALALVDAQQGS